MLAAPALLAGCGDGDPTVTGSGGQPTTTTAVAAPAREFPGELTSTDGYKYTITLAIAAQPAAPKADECPPATPPVTGTSTYPVTLTVRNQAPDRPAPFPPLRVELNSGGAVPPQQVMVKAPDGTCTFAPRLPSIAPGASVTFRGTSPPIATGVAPGSVGKIEVSVSESRFTVAAPVP